MLLTLLAASTIIATIHAQSITLKDTKGRAIEILPDSATEAEITGRRKSDNKKVTIKTDTLDAESKKAVEAWQKATGRIPSQEFEAKLTRKDGTKTVTAKFKMPAGKYNTDIDCSAIKLTFDIPRRKSEPLPGNFILTVYPTQKNLKEGLDLILKEMNQEIKDDLSRMTPSKRQEVEASAHPVAISHGEFSGYRYTYNSKNLFRTTNGKYELSAYLGPLSFIEDGESPVLQDDVIEILKTIEIKKGH